MPLQKLNAAQLNRLYAYLLTGGRADGTGGLSLKSVRETHVVIRKALEDALRRGMVARNVAALADPPPAHAAAADRRDKMAAWSEQELARFLRHAQDDVLHPLWALLASTGMRRSEVLGLPWRDVDLDGNRLAVRQGLVSVDAAQPRHATAAVGTQREDRLGTARPPLGRVHARHLRPRRPRHATTGRHPVRQPPSLSRWRRRLSGVPAIVPV